MSVAPITRGAVDRRNLVTAAYTPSRDVAALLAVGRALADGGELRDILDTIARQAAGAVSARAASIFLKEGRALRLAGSWGLSEDYASWLDGAPQIAPGSAPSGLAFERRMAVVVEDATSDPLFEPWKEIAAHEGYQALLSVPLLAKSEALGALTVYRIAPGPWPQSHLELIVGLAEYAATAIRTAQLMQRQQQQLSALSRLVAVLRQQTHEHANRLHTIGGLLALGEVADAQRFVADLQSAHHQSYGTIVDKVHNPTLAGLILAEMTIAQQRGIDLRLSARSALRCLPPSLGDAEAVTILGNLLQNAFDAVAEMPKRRRRVRLRVQDSDAFVIEVRDWGKGVEVGDDVRGRPLLAVLAGAGLRIGEALGLRWGDVDLAVGTLRVVKSKTDAGVRVVDLTPALREELAKHKADARFDGPDDYVFATATGRAKNRHNERRAVLLPAIKAANERLERLGIAPIGPATFHSLRRTFASIRAALGDDPAYIAEQIGHEDATFSLNVYAKAVKRRARLTGTHLEAFDRALEWAQTGTNGALTLPAVSLTGNAETANPA